MNRIKIFLMIAVSSIAIFHFNGYSKEIEETVLGMNVTGNKEAPNLLYIIPWKDNPNDNSPPQINRLMDEVYSTVDPDVFEKEVVFYTVLTEPLKSDKEVDN